MGHQAAQCPTRPVTNGPINQQIPGKPWCTHHRINTHDSSQCIALHPELATRPRNQPTRSSAAVHSRRNNRGTKDNAHKKELWKEYEKRHQISNASRSRGSSPASSHEIASENPLPIHVKQTHAQAVENQDRIEQFEFDLENLENKIHDETQAKAAQRKRNKDKLTKPEPAIVTKKRERKRTEKKYSRQRTETQFLRRNPDMPLRFRPSEEIEKFRSNARGGADDNNNTINYTEKSDTFRSLEIAKAEAREMPYFIPKDQLRTDAQRRKEEREKHMRSVK